MTEDLRSILRQMRIRRANHLPAAAQFCRRIGLMETVNDAVPSEMEVDIGTYVQAMVLDTLSGRSPLYRLEEFLGTWDTRALLGREVDPASFNDTTTGRAMDALYEAGTEKVFSQVAYRAAVEYSDEMDMRHVHFDTTSISVSGDYGAGGGQDGSITLARGHSKDNMPFLKQLILRMLCIRRNIPVLGGCEDGNASDMTVNNRELSRLSDYMATHGVAPGAYVYIADSAMVTEDNLEAVGDNLFITRLPFRYGEAGRAVSRAVSSGGWEEVPWEAPSDGGRPRARYRVHETEVDLYGRTYRGIVVHSDAHDRRRQGRLDRRLAESWKDASGRLADARGVEYYCREDAEAAMRRLDDAPAAYHGFDLEVTEKVTYARGRPPKNGPRKVSSVRYVIEGEVTERTAEVNRAREEAGCFVLLTNTPRSGEMAHSPREVLAAYKEQHGIERNFGFLKDPMILNSISLKSPKRIEVLGMILLLSLLVWNLMEHVMRDHLRQTETTLPGWDDRSTSNPTAFMMTTKFKGVQIVECAGERQFASPLTPTQQRYIEALGLDADTLLSYDGHAAAGNDGSL